MKRKQTQITLLQCFQKSVGSGDTAAPTVSDHDDPIVNVTTENQPENSTATLLLPCKCQ